MRLARVLFLSSLAAVLFAQTPTWDTSGNGMLSGTYYFRHVTYVLNFDANGNSDGTLADAAALYGTVTFDGAGKYSMSVTLADAQAGQLQKGNASGTYSIAASGQWLPFQSALHRHQHHRRRFDLRSGERAGHFRGQQHGQL